MVAVSYAVYIALYGNALNTLACRAAEPDMHPSTSRDAAGPTAPSAKLHAPRKTATSKLTSGIRAQTSPSSLRASTSTTASSSIPTNATSSPLRPPPANGSSAKTSKNPHLAKGQQHTTKPQSNAPPPTVDTKLAKVVVPAPAHLPAHLPRVAGGAKKS